MKSHRVIIGVLSLVLAGTASGLAQQTAEELYQAGLYQEEVHGDLEGAIEIYRTILNDHADSRAVAAKAQLHIGICYETLGLQEAQQAYERVVANYGDQSEVVRQARARLAALRPAVAKARGPVARLVLSGANPADQIDSHRAIIPSPDGHRVAYTQSNVVYVRDLATGETEQVASRGPTEVHGPPVWSADGKRLAFTVKDTATQVNVVKILDLSTRQTRTIPMPAEGEKYLLDWTRDGRQLLYSDERARSLHIMAVDDGTVTTVSDSVWPWQRATFSPDGRFVAYAHGATPRGPHTLCVQPVSGGPRREILESGDRMYLHPLWSPDGSAIGHQQSDGIWVVPMADGIASGPARLAYRTESPRWGIAWTAAGGLYYTANEQRNVPVRVEVDPGTGQAVGAPAEELTEYPGLGTYRWSPDGRRVALTGWHNDLTVYSIDTKTSTSFDPVEQEGRLWFSGGMWSPDGRELWYEHVLPGRAASIMKALDLASGSVREMFRLPPQSGAISLNADASRMAFMRPGSGVGSVEFVVAETGQTDGQVVATLKGSEMLPRRGPEISPGGDRVLYVVMGPRSAGAREGTIWVVGSDGTGARKLKEVPGIRSAMWDPSGRFVAYTARTDTTDTVLRVVDVATASEHDIPVPSTRNSYYLQDWSLDGRFIGFLRVDYWWEYWAVRGLLEGGG